MASHAEAEPQKPPGLPLLPLPESNLDIQKLRGWFSFWVEIRLSLEGREGEGPTGLWLRVPGLLLQRDG